MIFKRTFYRIILIAISTADKLLGSRLPGLRQRLRYLHQLLWERQYDEINKILRRLVSRFLPFLKGVEKAGYRLFQPVRIDVQTQRLLEDGTVAPKNSLVFRSHDTPLLVSIVIPCYNYGEYLSDAVNSALSQTITSLEVIIVDDGSTDKATKEVFKTYEDVPHVRLIRQANQGLPQTRNNGIAEAKGEYICCLDADDTIEPTYLEKCIALMESNRAVGFAYSHIRLFGDVEEIWQTRDFKINEALLNNYTSVAAVFRRDDWRAVGGFDPRMTGGYEDWEFWLRLACLGRKGRVIEEPLFNHRRHGHTMTHDAHGQRDALIARIRELNPLPFENRWFRRKLEQLQSHPQAEHLLHKLGQPPLSSPQDERPHMLVLVPGLAMGGAEVMLLDLLEHFSSDWRLSIVTNLPGEHELSDRFASLTPEIYHLPLFLSEAVWPDFAEALIGARQTRLVLSSNSAFAYDHVAALKRAFPDLRWIDILHNALPTGHLKSALAAGPNIDKQIAVAETVGEALRAGGVPEDRLAVIPNGVDTENLFNPDNVSREEARARFGLADDDFALTFVGRLSSEKRPLAYLDIIARLRQDGVSNESEKNQQHREFKGLMIGRGPLGPEVEKHIHKLELEDAVKRIDHISREEMPLLYAASDLLVVTSEIEGLPLTVLEALAMNCPVASTNVGDISSVVTPGVNGIVVPADKPLEIACLLGEANNIYEMYNKSNPSVLNEKYIQEKMVGIYNSIVNNINLESGVC